jgi:hypothetical protein
VRKLLGFAAGSAAVVSVALFTAGQASSTGPLDVTGQTYAQAVAILKQQGYMAVFGGSVGSDEPQGKCIVTSQKVMPAAWPAMLEVSLMLNCTKAAQPPPNQQPAPGGVAGAPNPNAGPPQVGSNGVTTVTATPVGPPPPAG